MKGLSTIHSQTLMCRLRRIVLLAMLSCAVLATARRAEAACLPAPAWASGPVGTITDPRPTFSWAAVPGATAYTLYILGAADDGPIIVRQTGITATSFRAPALPAGQDMRWKVKGEGACGAGAYASGQVFRVSVPASCPPQCTSF